MKLHGEKGKVSIIKETHNLAEKINYFREIDYNNLSQSDKDKELLLLIFVLSRINEYLKSRGCSNRSFKRVYGNKSECSSPTPDFFTFKYIYEKISQESRDVVTIDF